VEAFAVSIAALVVGIGLCMAIGRRRPPGTPLTWGQAMAAAVLVFGIMLVAYGIIPNQWLKWADNELLWRSDRILYKVKFFGRGQIMISYQALRDIIVTGIYVAMLGLHIVLWTAWQKRGRKPATDVTPTSAYGRPLAREA
jgi:hypothetical protein